MISRNFSVVMLSLYTLLLRYKIVETLYPATVAGLNYSTYPSEKGILLKVSGYSQNLHHLVEAFVTKLVSFADDVTEQEFSMFREQQLKNYYNTMINPKAYAKWVTDPNFHDFDIRKILKNNFQNSSLIHYRQRVLPNHWQIQSIEKINSQRLQTICQRIPSTIENTSTVPRKLDSWVG